MIVIGSETYFDLDECRAYLPLLRELLPPGSALREKRDVLHAARAEWANDREGIEAGTSPWKPRLQEFADAMVPLVPRGTDPRKFLFFALHATDGQLAAKI